MIQGLSYQKVIVLNYYFRHGTDYYQQDHIPFNILLDMHPFEYMTFDFNTLYLLHKEQLGYAPIVFRSLEDFYQKTYLCICLHTFFGAL